MSAVPQLAPGEPLGAGRSRRRLARGQFAVLALTPALLLLGALSLPPTFGAIGLAFRNSSLLSPTSRWIGFGNFVRMWSDPRFFNSLEVSLVWEIVTVSGAMTVAVLLGAWIYERVRGPRGSRTARSVRQKIENTDERRIHESGRIKARQM